MVNSIKDIKDISEFKADIKEVIEKIKIGIDCSDILSLNKSATVEFIN